jgi:hypothetical protein
MRDNNGMGKGRIDPGTPEQICDFITQVYMKSLQETR